MKDNAAYGFLTKPSDIKDDPSHPSLRRFSDRSLVIGHCLDFCPDPVLPGIKPSTPYLCDQMVIIDLPDAAIRQNERRAVKEIKDFTKIIYKKIRDVGPLDHDFPDDGGLDARRIQQEIKQCISSIDKEILPRLAENFHAQIRRMIEQPVMHFNKTARWRR